MNLELLMVHWHTETERIIFLLKNEFSGMSEEKLTYRTHISACNAKQILQHIAAHNDSIIARIRQALTYATIPGKNQEYSPGLIEKFVLNRIPVRCRIVNRNDRFLYSILSDELISRIIHQQQAIMELAGLCKSLDLNKKIIPFKMLGIIKLSIPGTMEYMILFQKYQFMKARHLLMIQ